MAIYIGSNTVASIVITNNNGVPLAIKKIVYANAPFDVSELFGGSRLPTTPAPTPSSTSQLQPSSTPQPTNTATPSSTPQPTNTATPSSTPQPTNTATPSSTPQPNNNNNQVETLESSWAYAYLDLKYVDSINVFDIIL